MQDLNLLTRPGGGSYVVPSRATASSYSAAPPALAGSALAGSSVTRPPLSYSVLPPGQLGSLGSPVPTARLGTAMRSVSDFADRNLSGTVTSLSASENSRFQPLQAPVRRGYSGTPGDLMGSVRSYSYIDSKSTAGPTFGSPSISSSIPQRTSGARLTKPSSVVAPSAAVLKQVPLKQVTQTATPEVSSLTPPLQTRMRQAPFKQVTPTATQEVSSLTPPVQTWVRQVPFKQATPMAATEVSSVAPPSQTSDPAEDEAPAPENVAALFVAGSIRTASVDETELNSLGSLAAADSTAVTISNGQATTTVEEEDLSRDAPGTNAPDNVMRLAPKPADGLATIRLQRPHGHFPFDIFSGKNGWKNLLANGGYGVSEELIEELGYVQSHCMTPPFPWGQIIYHDLVMNVVIEGGVKGDFAEFGIGLGGTSVFFARMAKKYGRKFLAVDSFEGLPEPDAVKDNHYFMAGDYCPLSGEDNYERWMQYNSKYDIDDVLYTRKCFFKDLEIPSEFRQFAFVHLDSDLYDSVYDSLEKVWDRMPTGGIIAIDDFFHHAQGPARAVADFFRVRCSEDEPPLLYVVPCYAVLVVKGRSACLWNPGDPDSAAAKRQLMHSPRALDGNFYSFKLVRQCTPLVLAVEHSVQRIRETIEQVQTDAEVTALSRCLSNAESFLNFLRYPETASRSGSDILRYLLALEDTWDIQQGKLCGLPGEARNLIQIQI